MNKEYFQTIHQIILCGHWITDQVGTSLKEYGITEPQYNVLRILAGAKGKPLAVQDILSKMVQRNSNITRIVDKLLAKGCVDRKECPSNRRKMDISITEKGLELLKILNKKVVAFHQPLMKNLNEEELKMLKHLIIKLNSKEDV